MPAARASAGALPLTATNAGVYGNLNPLARPQDVAELVALPPSTYNGTPTATHVRG